ncbi:hypothetical protein ACLFLC_21080 [Providencia rettgeri]
MNKKTDKSSNTDDVPQKKDSGSFLPNSILNEIKRRQRKAKQSDS